MSMLPSFLTAPRIRIRIGDATIAYALGFDVRFGVKLDPVMVVGSYGPVAIEPTMIGPVSGTLQIQRLLSTATISKKLTAQPGADANLALQGAVPEATGTDTAGAVDSGIVNQGDLFSHLDPSALLLSRTFDVDLYVLRPTNAALAKIQAGTPVAQEDLKLAMQLWLSVKDCRFTSRNTNISMGQLMNQPLNYNGLLVVPQTPAGFGLDQDVKDAVATV